LTRTSTATTSGASVFVYENVQITPTHTNTVLRFDVVAAQVAEFAIENLAIKMPLCLNIVCV